MMIGYDMIGPLPAVCISAIITINLLSYKTKRNLGKWLQERPLSAFSNNGLVDFSRIDIRISLQK